MQNTKRHLRAPAKLLRRALRAPGRWALGTLGLAGSLAVMMAATPAAALSLADFALDSVDFSAGRSVFIFTGDCTDCADVGIGVLKMHDYIGGNLLPSKFTSFEYKSNLVNLTLNRGQLAGLRGVLNLSALPGMADVYIERANSDPRISEGFLSSATPNGANNSWEEFAYFFPRGNVRPIVDDGGVNDYGRTHSWRQLIVTELSGTPEPRAWALLIVGFGMAGVGLRQRRRAAARV